MPQYPMSVPGQVVGNPGLVYPQQTSQLPFLPIQQGSDTPAGIARPAAQETKVDINAVKSAGSSKGSSAGSTDPSKGMRLAFKNVMFTVQAKNPETKQMEPKHILKGCTGFLKPGTLNAIMGSSGGGKTSLLDVLANRKEEHLVSGDVLVNGKPRDSKIFMLNSGYVVQDDIVMGTLTVRENLLFSARLRLPSEMSDDAKQRRVQEVIEELGLTKVADSRVGNEFVRGISGGERKRVNIGMELITQPTILFLDEPTTGLDSSTSLSVLNLLKRLAEHGRTIVLSIHQPRFRIFEMFDSVTIMSEGHIIYHGASDQCVPYFNATGYECAAFNNPADFILDVVTGEEPMRGEVVSEEAMDAQQKKEKMQAVLRRLCTAYADSSMARDANAAFERERNSPADDSKTMNTSFGAGWFQQVATCSGRAIKNVVRNPATSIGQVAVNVVVGVIVGCIYYRLDNNTDPERALRDRTGCIFFCIINFMFGNLGGIEMFLAERLIFMHEKASGYYHTSSYYVSKLLCDMIPVRVVPTIIFATTVYFMAGLQRDAEKYFIFVGVSILQSMVACSVCFFFSACCSVFAIANLLVTMWYVMTMIFSGLLVSITSWPDGSRWIGYLSFCKYSYELLVENEFTGLTFDCSDGGACTGEEMLGPDYLNIDRGNGWLKVMALLIMTLFFLTLAYIQLNRLRRK